MPNRIQRLPASIKSAPKKEKQAAAQRVVDEILRQRGLRAETDDGKKRIVAAYNTTRRCWQLQAQKTDDEPLCKTILTEISARVKAEQPCVSEEKPAHPPAVQVSGPDSLQRAEPVKNTRSCDRS
jgi:hypothetical protein